MAVKVVKRLKFLKGGTNVASTPRFPGLSGPRFAAKNSNNRRVRVRG